MRVLGIDCGGEYTGFGVVEMSCSGNWVASHAEPLNFLRASLCRGDYRESISNSARSFANTSPMKSPLKMSFTR